MSNRWNRQKAAIFAAAPCAVGTALQHAAWWGLGPDYVARAAGAVIGAGLIGWIIGFGAATIRNSWTSRRSSVTLSNAAADEMGATEHVDLAQGQTCVGGAYSATDNIALNHRGETKD